MREGADDLSMGDLLTVRERASSPSLSDSANSKFVLRADTGIKGKILVKVFK